MLVCSPTAHVHAITPHTTCPHRCVWLCGMRCGVVCVVMVAGRGAGWCGWTSVWMDGHGGDKEMGFQSTHHTPKAWCGEMRCTRWWHPCNTPTTAPQPSRSTGVEGHGAPHQLVGCVAAGVVWVLWHEPPGFVVVVGVVVKPPHNTTHHQTKQDEKNGWCGCVSSQGGPCAHTDGHGRGGVLCCVVW